MRTDVNLAEVHQRLSLRGNRGRTRLAIGMALAAAILTLASFVLERFIVWAALPAVLLVIGAAVLSGAWPAKRRWVVVLILDLTIVFGYLWTLDESVHVEVRATANGYIATIGNDVLRARVPVRAGRVALMAGDVYSYRVLPTGEAPFPEFPSLLNRLGEAVRLATPQPAWSNVTITRAGKTQHLGTPQYILAGSGSVNIRGEWESAGGAAAFAPVLSPPYTISADLVRPDGTQGLLVGLTQSGQAYYLQIRMDRPDASWTAWSAGQARNGVAGASIRTDFVEMLQRVLRILSACAIAGLVVCGAILLLSTLLSRLLGAFGNPNVVAGVEQALSRPGVAVAAAAVAAGAAVVLAALIAQELLGGIPHVQDDVAYVFQARTLALGHLSMPLPKFPGFFAEPFIDMYRGRWFGKYAPGWPLLLAVGERMGQGWLVNPVLAGIDVVLVFFIGREVSGRTVGLVASCLTLSSPFFLFLAGTYMAHTATLAYLAGFALLTIRWTRSVERGEVPATWPIALAGVLLGMAGITRQVDALAFSVPFVLLAFSRPVRTHLPRAIIVFVLSAAVPVVVMGIYDWVLTGTPLTTPYAIWSPLDRLGFGTSVLYDNSPAQGLHNTSLNLQMLLADLFGWPFYLTLGIALTPFLLGRATRWDVLFGVSTLCVMGVYVFYWGTGIMYGPRYYYVTIPWLVLLTARGFEELCRLPARASRGLLDPSASFLACALLACGLVVYEVASFLPTNIPIYNGYNFVSAAPVNAVRGAGIHDALIFTVSNPPSAWWAYGEVFSSNSPALTGDIIYARDLGAADSTLMREYPLRQYYRLDGTLLTRIYP